ncbi:MAG: DUF1830 domain-containing protein [Cyanobacteria bacterium J06627_3]
MAQTLDPIPFDSTDTVLCCYVNSASKIQVVRITNIQNWYFERVVFPGQRLMFESSVKGQLEVHSGAMASSILEDTIPCTRLTIAQSEDEMAGAAAGSIDAMQPVHS